MLTKQPEKLIPPPPPHWHAKIIKALICIVIFLGAVLIEVSLAPNHAYAANNDSRVGLTVSVDSNTAHFVRSGRLSTYGSMYTRWSYTDGQLSYCMQPPKYPPDTGYYAKRYWYGNEMFYGVLYFGYGGPGFDYAVSQGWWPTRNYRGQMMNVDDYYSTTHVLISSVYSSDYLYGTGSSYRQWYNSQVGTRLYNNIRSHMYLVPQSFRSGCFYLTTGATQDIAGCAAGYSSGGISLHKKQYGTNSALSGINFNIYYSNASGAKGSIAASITTDGAGNASTQPNALKCGYYLVEETNPPAGCKASRQVVSVNRNFGVEHLEFTNTPYVDIDVSKQFIGPAFDAQLSLRRDGVEVASISTGGKDRFTYNWSMIKTDPFGRNYTYEVSEKGVQNGKIYHNGLTYLVSQNGNRITNTCVIDKLSVKKIWDDQNNEYNTRPGTITVYPRQIEIETGAVRDLLSEKRQLTSQNDWSETWTNLPRYNDAGKELQYEVVELVTISLRNTYSSQATTIRSEDGQVSLTTLTNSLKTTTITINKTWVGDKEKPNIVTFNIIANDGEEYTVDVPVEGVSQSKEVELPSANREGKIRLYNVNEQEIEGWHGIKSVAGSTFTFKNVISENLTIPVDKTWVDAENTPDSVEVTLYRRVHPDDLPQY